MPSPKKIAKKIGIDKSIAYTSTSRIIQAAGGIITALFIVRFLTGVEQGFYYTFGSILAIQTFFELGMNGIITQYVAHEMSHLKWNGYGLEGERKYLSRLSSLLHFCFRWYSLFAIVLFIVLILAGCYFFTRYDRTGGAVNWKLPWIILCCTTSVNLMIAPMFAFLEGLGKVKEVAKYRFFQISLGLLIVWLSLSCGAKLLTAGINSVTWVAVAVFAFTLSPFGAILRKVYRIPVVEKVSYVKEIFPFQWKIALSWVSGYFIFQLFNPILFACDGAVVAGQMGMTLAALTGIQALTYSWTSTKVPTYSGMIEMKRYGELDTLFNRTVKQAVSINAACLLLFFAVVFAIREFHFVIFGLYLGDRFLACLPLVMMMIPEFLNQFITAWATYLRCHKKEPYLVNSIVTGVLCCLSTVGMGKWSGLGVYGITTGYCLITLAVTPWAYYIFTTKKKLWHQQTY